MVRSARVEDEAGTVPVETRISTVGEDLARSLRRVLEALPGGAARPNQLAELLGLNRDISGRVLSATRARDPLAVTHGIPGPEPLRKLLRAARRKSVDPELIAEAERAVGQFEVLIREVAGDRPALDAIISSLLPPAREKFELAAKQTIFKGTSLLKGAMADLWLHTALVHPSTEVEDTYDVAHVFGTLGLRRVRPNVVVKFAYRQFGTPRMACHALDGGPIEASDGTELDRFCTLTPARMDVTATDDGAVHALSGNEVGPRSATDKLLAEVRPAAMGCFAADQPRNRKSMFVAPSVPVKTLHFDLLLHDDAYPEARPTLLVYDTAVEGMASVNDPARDADLLDVRESVTFLGRGREALPLDDMHRYVDMLDHVSGRLGWDLDAFRGFRCRIQYPMHGSQACLAFEAPARPS